MLDDMMHSKDEVEMSNQGAKLVVSGPVQAVATSAVKHDVHSENEPMQLLADIWNWHLNFDDGDLVVGGGTPE